MSSSKIAVFDPCRRWRGDLVAPLHCRHKSPILLTVTIDIGGAMMRFAFALTLGLAAAASLAATDARAGVEDCSDSSVLNFIDHRFDYKAYRYLRADLDIVRIHAVASTGIAPRDATHSVERVYCHAKVDMNDGHRRDLWYMVQRNWGFAGLGRNVRFCISGLDPWHVDGRDCRSVR